MSEIKVNKVSPATGTAITLGDSGDTFTVPSGATIVNSGTATGFGGGKVKQIKYTTNSTYSTVAGSSSNIPLDDSIPTSSEGTSMSLDVTLTASSATNLLLFQGVVNWAHSSYGDMIGALFNGTTCVWASKCEASNTSPNQLDQLIINYVMQAGSTSSQTFSVRIGRNTAGTLYINGGETSGRKFGGTLISQLIVTELEP